MLVFPIKTNIEYFWLICVYIIAGIHFLSTLIKPIPGVIYEFINPIHAYISSCMLRNIQINHFINIGKEPV